MSKIMRLVFNMALLAALAACSTSVPLANADQNSYRINILSQYSIPRSEINGLTVSELSDVAWDEDEQLLYAVSDKNYLLHFKLQLENQQIINVKPVYARSLSPAQADHQPRPPRDPEGLSALNTHNGRRGDTQLVIAFEYMPRVLRTNTAGQITGEYPLPPPLRDRHNYRPSNKALESVVMHPQYGMLTAPEAPLKKQPDNLHTVYSAQQTWSFMAYPAPNSSITALEVLPDNSLLVLERAWNGVGNPMVIALRRVDLANCSPKGACTAENLKVTSSLFSIDNFEGLTRLKDNLYLMVSDDSSSDWLRNRLTLFRVE